MLTGKGIPLIMPEFCSYFRQQNGILKSSEQSIHQANLCPRLFGHETSFIKMVIVTQLGSGHIS
jgi:hypothetical protein